MFRKYNRWNQFIGPVSGFSHVVENRVSFTLVLKFNEQLMESKNIMEAGTYRR
jgi:hypothetical protein